MEKISVKIALSYIDILKDEFELTYIKESTGEIRKEKFLKGSKNPIENPTDNLSEKKRVFYNVKEAGVLMLYSVTNKRPASIKIRNIIQYNEYRIQH